MSRRGDHDRTRQDDRRGEEPRRRGRRPRQDSPGRHPHPHGDDGIDRLGGPQRHRIIRRRGWRGDQHVRHHRGRRRHQQTTRQPVGGVIHILPLPSGRRRVERPGRKGAAPGTRLRLHADRQRRLEARRRRPVRLLHVLPHPDPGTAPGQHDRRRRRRPGIGRPTGGPGRDHHRSGPDGAAQRPRRRPRPQADPQNQRDHGDADHDDPGRSRLHRRRARHRQPLVVGEPGQHRGQHGLGHGRLRRRRLLRPVRLPAAVGGGGHHRRVADLVHHDRRRRRVRGLPPQGLPRLDPVRGDQGAGRGPAGDGLHPVGVRRAAGVGGRPVRGVQPLRRPRVLLLPGRQGQRHGLLEHGNTRLPG